MSFFDVLSSGLAQAGMEQDGHVSESESLYAYDPPGVSEDAWEIDAQGGVVRVHNEARVALFVPFCEKNGPLPSQLESSRTTIYSFVDETGASVKVDNWRVQKDAALGKAWTGKTIFVDVGVANEDAAFAKAIKASLDSAPALPTDDSLAAATEFARAAKASLDLLAGASLPAAPELHAAEEEEEEKQEPVAEVLEDAYGFAEAVSEPADAVLEDAYADVAAVAAPVATLQTVMADPYLVVETEEGGDPVARTDPSEEEAVQQGPEEQTDPLMDEAFKARLAIALAKEPEVQAAPPTEAPTEAPPTEAPPTEVQEASLETPLKKAKYERNEDQKRKKADWEKIRRDWDQAPPSAQALWDRSSGSPAGRLNFLSLWREDPTFGKMIVTEKKVVRDVDEDGAAFAWMLKIDMEKKWNTQIANDIIATKKGTKEEQAHPEHKEKEHWKLYKVWSWEGKKLSQGIHEKAISFEGVVEASNAEEQSMLMDLYNALDISLGGAPAIEDKKVGEKETTALDGTEAAPDSEEWKEKASAYKAKLDADIKCAMQLVGKLEKGEGFAPQLASALQRDIPIMEEHSLALSRLIWSAVGTKALLSAQLNVSQKAVHAFHANVSGAKRLAPVESPNSSGGGDAKAKPKPRPKRKHGKA